MKGGEVEKDKEFERALYEFNVVKDMILTRLRLKYGRKKVDAWLKK